MRGALILLAAAVAAVLGGGALLAATWHLGYGHGLYCAVGTASTVGCDTVPSSAAGRAVSAAVMLTAIPLLAACFARLSALHIARGMADVRAAALAAHKISADLHERLTGHAHPLAPDDKAKGVT